MCSSPLTLLTRLTASNPAAAATPALAASLSALLLSGDAALGGADGDRAATIQVEWTCQGEFEAGIQRGQRVGAAARGPSLPLPQVQGTRSDPPWQAGGNTQASKLSSGDLPKRTKAVWRGALSWRWQSRLAVHKLQHNRLCTPWLSLPSSTALLVYNAAVLAGVTAQVELPTRRCINSVSGEATSHGQAGCSNP